jgi:hypothetical protein
MITRKALPRRTFLRGIGTVIGLPVLDAMAPAFASTIPGKAPVRLAFVYVPNGILMSGWEPDYDGNLGELPRTLKPMEPFRDDILLLGNLTNNPGRRLLEGGGDHGRCSGSYLTAVPAHKSLTDIRAGISCDQVVANHIGSKTRLPSLEIGMEDAKHAGECDTGYSCAYTDNISWKSARQPLPPTVNPRALFERLFGTGADLTPAERARNARFRRSILDFVTDDTRKLESGLGPTDRRKLDEYLTSIREIEQQLERAENDNTRVNPGMEKPYGVPADFGEHFKLLTSMITVAFQADLTRVLTFLVTPEGSQRAYREIDIPDGHHPLTHHRNEAPLMEKVARINVYHMRQFAAWMGKLKSIQEGDSNLLANSMIVYGAGLGDGNLHTHFNLPTMVVGHGGKSLKPGRRVVYQKETPLSNLFVSLMDRMDVHVESFGDSTDRLYGLDSAV